VPTAAGAVTVRTGRESGGPALLLLHGAAGSWTTWTPLLAAADRCGMPLTDVVAIDLPGWGDSPGPVPTPGRMAAVVADVARALGYAQWHVAGHSLGGAVALDVAARFGAETLSVALVSPSGAGVRDAVRHPVRGGWRLPGFAGMLWAMRMLSAFGAGSPAFLRALRATGVLRLLTRPLFRYPAGVDRTVTDALADEVRPASFVAAAAAAREYDEALWDRIRCPVRSVRGERDVFARADDADAFRRRIPAFDEHVLAGAGHFAHVELPVATLLALAPAWAPASAGAVRSEAVQNSG